MTHYSYDFLRYIVRRELRRNRPQVFIVALGALAIIVLIVDGFIGSF